MKENVDNHSIDKEAQGFIELGTLLQRERPEELQASINKILQHKKLSTEEKIQRIREIDNREENPPRAEPSSVSFKGPGGAAGRATENTADRAQRLFKKMAHKWALLKAPLQRTGLFHFFFKDYSLLRRFSQESHVTRVQLIPPRVNFIFNITETTARSFQKTASELAAMLQPLRENAWLYLKKEDYNRLALLHRLCLAIVSRPLGKETDNLRNLENYFFAIHKDNSRRAINTSLDYLHKRAPRLLTHPALLEEMIQTLLSPREQIPSLIHFIRGANMVKYRRYLDMKDLLLPGTEMLIADSFYDAPTEVALKIDAHIDNTAKKLTQLHKKWSRIQKMKNYLPRDDQNRLNLIPLVEFYEKKQSFKKDKDSLLVFLHRFLDLLLSTYGELLNGKVTPEKGPPVAVFEPSCFEMTMAKLYQIKNIMDQLALTFPNFSRTRYFDLLKTNNRGAIAIERETMAHIGNLLKLLHRMALKLSHLLTHSYHTQADQPAEEPLVTYDPSSGRPLEKEEAPKPIPVISLKDTHFDIPAKKCAIKAPRDLKGQTVEEALVHFTRLCYLTHAHFSSSDFVAAIEMESHLEKEIRNGLKRIERIGTPEQKQQVSKAIFPFT